MDRTPAHHEGTPGIDPVDDLGAAPEPGLASDVEVWEPLEDTARHAGRRVGARVVASFPGAIAGAFLITALAFGAAFRPAATPSDGTTGGDGPDPKTAAGLAGADATAKPAAHLGDDAEPAPADEPKDSPTDAPTDEPKPEPTADEPKAGTEPGTPAVEALTLALHLRDGFVKLSWSTCAPDGFRAYKVVRSYDERPTWPTGEGDGIAAVIEDASVGQAADHDLKPGRKLYYRVFALVDGADGLVAACQSPVRGIAIPAHEPEPTEKPAPEPTEKPKPTEAPGVVGTLGLSVALEDGKPWVDWTECQADFHVYKVVRSSDNQVTWPKGDNDSGVAAVGPDGKTAVRDGEAKAGKTWWYRVFCLREGGDGYVVVAASAVKGIEVPAAQPDPEPEPVALSFQVEVVEGKVSLHWEACTSDRFIAYKIVRSAQPNPSYLPGTDGSQVIGVIESAGTTSFADHEVDAGQTWYYRVQAIGWMNEHKILLGQTAAIAATVE